MKYLRFIFIVPLLMCCSFFQEYSLVDSISLSSTSLSMDIGEQQIITATLSPSETSSGVEINWESDNNDIVSVSTSGFGNDGIIHAVSAGTALITVSASDKTKTLLVTVSPDNGLSKYISCQYSALAMKMNDVKTVTAQLINSDTPSQDRLQWTCDKPEIIDILGSGKSVILTALKAGDAHITISHPDASYDYTFTIRVTGISLKLSLNKTYLNMMVSDTVALTATLIDADDSDYSSLVWSESDPDNAISILGTGKEVTVRANVTTTQDSIIRVTHPATGKYAECTVVVSASKRLIVNPGNITIAPTESYTLTVDKQPSSMAITATPLDGNICSATIDNATGNIIVTGKNEGTTAINIVGTSISDSVSVTVFEPRTFEIDDIAEMQPTESVSLEYTVTPSTLSVTATSSNSAIATVTVDSSSKKVIISGKKEGSCTVTVAAENMKKVVNVTVQYADPITVDYTFTVTGTGHSASLDKWAKFVDANSELWIYDGQTFQLKLNLPQSGLVYSSFTPVYTGYAGDGQKVSMSVSDAGKTLTFQCPGIGTAVEYESTIGTLSITIPHGNGGSYSRTITVKFHNRWG